MLILDRLPSVVINKDKPGQDPVSALNVLITSVSQRRRLCRVLHKTQNHIYVILAGGHYDLEMYKDDFHLKQKNVS